MLHSTALERRSFSDRVDAIEIGLVLENFAKLCLAYRRPVFQTIKVDSREQSKVPCSSVSFVSLFVTENSGPAESLARELSIGILFS